MALNPRPPGWPAVVALVLATGCGSREPAKHPVSGVVLVNGKPAARVTVSLEHTSPAVRGNARHPVAVTDEAGRFTLSTDGHGDGAVAGDYVVTFAWLSAQDPFAAYDRLGGAFADPKASQYRITVPPPGGGELEPFRLTISERKLVSRNPGPKSGPGFLTGAP